MEHIIKQNPQIKTAPQNPGKFFTKRIPLHGNIQPKLTVNQANDPYEQQADAMAEQVMRMPDHKSLQQPFFKPVPFPLQRKCENCEEEENKVHLKRENGNPDISGSGVESYVNRLNDKGQNLSTEARNFYEPRFGYDFSHVKIHTDEEANRSAKSINALAYTSGNHIVFRKGQYSHDSGAGKKLLGHELTHVVQQYKGMPNRSVQRMTCPEGATAPATVAQGQANAIDTRAQAIIDKAQDQNVPIQDRATRVVSDIICAYYPQHSDKVRNINYDASLIGLRVRSVGSGSTIRGDITAGDYFVSNTNGRMIARRILQVGHELDHIGQYRSGLTGGQNVDQREFLAFYHNGVADEFAGTRRMPHSMRRRIIDQALGYYYCLDASLQQNHQSKRQELITRRQTVNGTAGNPSTNPPTSCIRQH